MFLAVDRSMKTVFRKISEIACPMVLVATVFFSGCAAFPPLPPPVTQAEILQMAKDGMPATDIIARLRNSRRVYAYSASELAILHQQGVPDQVIDYIQSAYVEAVRRDEAQRAFMYGGYGWGPPFWGPRGGFW